MKRLFAFVFCSISFFSVHSSSAQDNLKQEIGNKNIIVDLPICHNTVAPVTGGEIIRAAMSHSTPN
ncbi:hypothetical protein ACTHGU_12795 [Chitinophagaceae bacterium MMS25-I14]